MLHNTRALYQLIRLLLAFIIFGVGAWQAHILTLEQQGLTTISKRPVNSSQAAIVLSTLEIKGRAPKTNYSRAQFSNGWGDIDTCDARNYVLQRDLHDVTLQPFSCIVDTGILHDPYTARTILFRRGPDTSGLVQIDHVVSLSDAWQKGAQYHSSQTRYMIANDPLNLLAVQGDANQAKGDGDAATWLPENKTYRCRYVARQIAVKQKYELWVTQAEYQAMERVLQECPDEKLPS